MGVDKVGKDNKDFAAGFAAGFAAAREEEDFHYHELTCNVSGNSTIANEAAQSSKGFPAVTEEDLNHLAPGCFVQVGLGESSYWVEIGRIDGVTISGMVHPELSSSLCLIDHDSCEVARFSRDQITALGCDRYCWC
jgi:hypothetical protein